ncbi:uncharacterized protein CCR75_005138 [Bremia lactucae]|uniref:Uncharacterized protein n=1 Tax=Bremia lactucae TaxID=4779 RepID=A0A976FPI2_BRELC|nr:hypothetical protein CCR75_005138 [Bremia lactucae]
MVMTMESEMVLLAMLPEEDRVLLVQTPGQRTIADLEEFIVDEYTRVFPHLPPLSRNLRIQKCVAPELVVDRRVQASVRHRIPHVFVDLAKNVHAANVFENMELIYIVANMPEKLEKLQNKNSSLDAHHAPISKNALESLKAVTRKGRDSKKKKVEKEASQKSASKTKQPDTTKKVLDKVEKTTTKIECDDEVKDTQKVACKESADAIQPPTKDAKRIAEKKYLGTGKATARKSIQKIALKKDSDEENIAIGKIEVSKLRANKKINISKKMSQEPCDSNQIETDEDNSADLKVRKKAIPRKSENALLKRMLAAKPGATDLGAALIVNLLNEVDRNGIRKELPKSDKASEDDFTEKAVCDTQEPPVKKKKTLGEKHTKQKNNATSKAKEKKIDHEKRKPAKKKSVSKPPKKENTLNNSDAALTEDVCEDLSTANVVAAPALKPKKKTETLVGTAKQPATKRSRKESTVANKKALEIANPAVRASKEIMNGESFEGATLKSISESSDSSAGFPIQAVISVSDDEIEVADSPATKALAECSLKQKRQNAPTDETFKSKFESVLKKRKKQILNETSGKDDAAVDGKLKRTSLRSSAIKPSLDSDVLPAVMKKAKRSSNLAAPVNSSSSTSSDEEKSNYSKSILADLTSHDTGGDVVSSAVVRKGKMPRKDGTDDFAPAKMLHESSQEASHSSEFSQKSHETNSFLLSTLSKNRFSLGSIPVAKLKNSSKNPFTSKKTSNKIGNDTNRKRDRD